MPDSDRGPRSQTLGQGFVRDDRALVGVRPKEYPRGVDRGHAGQQPPRDIVGPVVGAHQLHLAAAMRGENPRRDPPTAARAGGVAGQIVVGHERGADAVAAQDEDVGRARCPNRERDGAAPR